MSININTIKEICELVVNKNQSGSLTPARFNTACQSVNWEWFNFCYGQPVLSKNGQQSNDMFWQSTEKITNNLRPFIKKVVLQIDQTGKANKPTDFVQTSSVRYWYGTKQIEVQMINDGGISTYTGSELFTPTKYNPIYCVYDDRIQFYPKDLGRVEFTYLRKPATPIWGYTTVNGRPVYDATASVDFEYPEENVNEIAMRICSLWGISIRENQITQYTEQQQQQGV